VPSSQTEAPKGRCVKSGLPDFIKLRPQGCTDKKCHDITKNVQDSIFLCINSERISFTDRPAIHNHSKTFYYFLKIALPPSGMGLECTTEQTEKVQRAEDESTCKIRTILWGEEVKGEIIKV
jgi:hypothetical protein